MSRTQPGGGGGLKVGKLKREPMLKELSYICQLQYILPLFAELTHSLEVRMQH